MRTIHKHVTSSFLFTFVVTLVVCTFVSNIWAIVQMVEFLSRGVSVRIIAQLFLSSVPFALAMTIPISLLMASLLLFGRLSADGEITAMKACGVSLRQAISPCLLVAFGLIFVCVYIHNELAPRSHYLRRSLTKQLGAGDALDLLEEGRIIQDFHGLQIFIGRKKGLELKDVRVYDLRDGTRREIRAQRGTVSTNATDITFTLHGVRIDPLVEGMPGWVDVWTLPPIGDARQDREYTPDQEDMTFAGLWTGIRDAGMQFPQFSEEGLREYRMLLAVELHKRLALSVACFAFVLLGIPLGIVAHRKESTIGVLISMVLALIFYLFIIGAESLKGKPAFRPDLIVWLPVAISIILGTLLVRRSE